MSVRCPTYCRFLPGDVVSIGITGLLMHVTGAHLSTVSVRWWCGTTMYEGKFDARMLIHRQPVKRGACVCDRRKRT